MSCKIKSDGLGGFYGVSQTLQLGVKKRITFIMFCRIILPSLIISQTFNGEYNISCLGTVLSLQRSNEIYKSIKFPQNKRRLVPSTKNVIFSLICVIVLWTITFALWLSVLLLRNGDVHPNPGPDSGNDTLESSLSSTSTLQEMLSNHLSIFHINIQSLQPKLDLLKCEAEAYDVLVFSESWLKPTIPNEDISFENFMPPFRRDRTGRLGGGVAVYVRETFPCKRRTDLEIGGLEAVWVEILVRSKKILLGGFYRPPDSNTDYFNLIVESIDRAYNLNISDIIITGDFNCDMFSNHGNKIRDLMHQFNLHQLINEATNFTEHSSSLLDLFLVRNSSNILMSGVIDTFIPDQRRFHCPIIALLKFTRPSLKSFKRRIWNYQRANFDLFRDNLSNYDWNHLTDSTDFDSDVKHFTEAILKAGEQSIPNKIVTIRPFEHPWITSRIKNLIRQRKRTYRKFKKTNNMRYWEKYKRLRNIVVNAIRVGKQEYFDKLEHKLNVENSNTKIFWKTSKQLLNLGKNSQNIPTLRLGNECADNDKQKATALNDYFSSQSTVNDNNKSLPPPIPIEHEQLSMITITSQDVRDVLDNLDVTKSCGPDLLSPRLLKEASPIISRPLSVFFNSLLQHGYFPAPWKDANVVPVHKKDDKSLPSNYRPISLISNLGKSMERCVHKHMYNYVIENRLLTPYQSGFRSGDSTTFQLLHSYHIFCEAVDSGKEIRVVFCDISKAFDRVWHRGLLHKLANLGISGSLLKWFSSYLSGRRQRVVINGQTSDWAYILAGVPQGSILGPLLFLVYINDIVNGINSSIRLFADDTSLYIIVDTPQLAADSLNVDLRSISVWAGQWLVEFNPAKTISMVISKKREPETHPPLFMNSVAIAETSNHKHLGLTFSNLCTWDYHVETIVESAWTRLNLLRTLKFKINRKALEKIYTAFVRPLLEYSDAVWDNCSSESKKMLDSVHVEAARIITGATKLCSIDKLLSDLGWDTLQERRNKHKLVIFFKMLNNCTPNYLSDLIPPLVQEGNPYNLRNSDHIQTIHARTNLFFNSFLPSTIRAWNNLPEDIKQADSVASFKALLNRDIKSLQDTTMLELELDKYFMRDYAWNVALSTPIFTAETLSKTHHAPVETSKAHIISSSLVPNTQI